MRDEALRVALSDRGAVVLPIVATDRSMEPTLYGGDAVLAVPLGGAPRRGDLLVYRHHDELVVHRYLGTARAPSGAPCLRTRGDGRRELDPPVLPDAVRARVAAIRRRGAWRSLDGIAPRVYAQLVAWHDLAWAAAIHVLRPVGLAPAAAAIDRALLRFGTATALAWTHRPIEAPEGAVPPVSV